MNQTSQELSRPFSLVNRRSKECQSKKTQNVSKKNLNAAFRALSVEFSPEITKELADFSPVSEVSDSNRNSEISQSLELAPEPFILSDLTPSSTITTVNKDALSVSDLSPDRHRFKRPDASKFGLAEADTAGRFLERARHQVLNSADADAVSKKLLDTLITTVVDELSYAAAAAKRDDDRLTELVLMKARVVSACFLIWILAVIVILFFGSGSGPSYIGPLPT